ncbi:hypothetical protein VO54_00574 [Elizabethkingia miricola]|nr:hypothetical protein VO54_00574 [Elizabethkingia miricola]
MKKTILLFVIILLAVSCNRNDEKRKSSATGFENLYGKKYRVAYMKSSKSNNFEDYEKIGTYRVYTTIVNDNKIKDDIYSLSHLNEISDSYEYTYSVVKVLDDNTTQIKITGMKSMYVESRPLWDPNDENIWTIIKENNNIRLVITSKKENFNNQQSILVPAG